MVAYRIRPRFLPTRWALCLLGVVWFGLGGRTVAAVEPSWQLRYRATGRSSEVVAPDGTSSTGFDHYHVLSGNASGLAGGRLTLRGAARFADLEPGRDRSPALSRWYSGVCVVRIGADTRAVAGRQFVQAGVTGLTLDGIRLHHRLNGRWRATGWVGAKAPTDLAFKTNSLSRDAALGGRIAYRASDRWRWGFSTAYRERDGRIAARPVGGELVTGVVPHTRTLARVAYDLEQAHWIRLQAQAQWRRTANGPTVDLQYIDRYPTVDAASWFARFMDLKRIRLARLAVRYENAARFGGEATYLGSFVGDRTASRLGVAALVPGGRVGYSLRLGDDGEENRFYGEYGFRPRPWLRLDAEATVLTYALLRDAPADQERDLTTLAARARIDLRPGLRVLAEVQDLHNPAFDHDVRFLVGMDMSLARGNSRLGLDRGGWLR